MNVPLLEICVDSLISARAAIAGGADRLELCSALSIGGLTPYTDLLLQIRSESDIPVRCLIRPRGGDFLYTAEELAMMAAQITALRQAGADGFVIGCLDADGCLDRVALFPLLRAAKGRGLTLHRCIDVSRDPLQTYLAAAALGFDTVLTSGGAANCLAGQETIGQMLALQSEINGPEVLIGAGVNAAVITQLCHCFPGARAFHASCKTAKESAMRYRRQDVPMGLPGLDEWHIQQTDETSVRQAKTALFQLLAK